MSAFTEERINTPSRRSSTSPTKSPTRTITYPDGLNPELPDIEKIPLLKRSIEGSQTARKSFGLLARFPVKLVVIIDGNISTGKTTALAGVKKILDDAKKEENDIKKKEDEDEKRLIEENTTKPEKERKQAKKSTWFPIPNFLCYPEDGHHGPVIELALSDPCFSGTFQMHMFSHCTKRTGMAKAIVDNTAQNDEATTIAFVDRSTDGNMHFALVNYFLCRDEAKGNSSNIKDHEMMMYMTVYADNKQTEFLGNLNVFLWCSPSMCRSRVSDRGISVEDECYVKKDPLNRYLWQIAYVQMFWLLDVLSRKDSTTKFVVLDWNAEVQDPSDILSVISDCFISNQHPARIELRHTFEEHTNSFWSSPSTYGSSASFPSKDDQDMICHVMSMLCMLRTQAVELDLPWGTASQPFTFEYTHPVSGAVSVFHPLNLTFEY